MHNNRQKGIIEILLLVGGITAILFVGGFYLMTQKKTQDSSVPVAQIANSSQIGEALTVEELDAEFEAISLDDISKDFEEIDNLSGSL